jgi:hypothetical protein
MAEGAVPGAVIGRGIGFLAGGVGAGPGASLGAAGGAVIGGAYEGAKYIWQYLTQSPNAVRIETSTTPVNIDGRKIAEIVTKYQAKEGAGPPEGAPYHNATQSISPIDFVLVP